MREHLDRSSEQSAARKKGAKEAAERSIKKTAQESSFFAEETRKFEAEQVLYARSARKGEQEEEEEGRTTRTTRIRTRTRSGKQKRSEEAGKAMAAGATRQGASSLMGFIPKAMRPTYSDIGSGVLWGGTGLLGAIWLVQPFGWMKNQLFPPPKEEQK